MSAQLQFGVDWPVMWTDRPTWSQTLWSFIHSIKPPSWDEWRTRGIANIHRFIVKALWHSLFCSNIWFPHYLGDRGFPRGQMVKNLPTTVQETWVQSLSWEYAWEKGMATTPVFLPGESHGQRSLAGSSPWDHKELDMTNRLTLSLWGDRATAKSTSFCIRQT